MTAQEIIAKASEITVINDGQVRYPVMTADLQQWIATNGAITNDNYDQFCAEVENVGELIALTGTAEMIDLCEQIVDAGSSTELLG